MESGYQVYVLSVIAGIKGVEVLTDNILDLIGNTHLVKIRGESVYAKAEFFDKPLS